MTLILDISPELETDLLELAANRGQDAVTFATSTLESSVRNLRDVAGGSVSASGGTARDAEIDEILAELASIGADLPPCSDGDLHLRDNLYEDHD